MSIDLAVSDFASSKENPLNWPKSRKWRVLGISCLLTFLAGLNSSAPTTAFPEISHEFGLPDGYFEIPFFMVTTWNIAAGLIPMFTLSMMDTYGTYFTYVISYSLFMIFILPQALAPNFATLVVTRFFAGAFGGTLQNGVEAVLANLFESRQERVSAVTLYTLALVGGVTLGPVQGAITQLLGWRWVFWLQLIIYAAALPIVILGLQETRGSVISAKLNKNMGSSTRSISEGRETARKISKTLLRSGKLLLTEFIVFSLMLWCAFSYGLIFISTESIAAVFGTVFGFETYQTGLIQTAMFVGELIGAAAYILFQRYIITSPSSDQNTRRDSSYEEDKTETGKTYKLEKEIYLSVPATIIGLSGGLFIYAWTGYEGFAGPWIAPAIGLALQGFAVVVIIAGAGIYLTECYSKYAASAVAGVAIGENLFSAILPLAALPMYTNLGFQWASSLLACLGLVLVLPPIALIWKGSAVRGRSRAIQELAGK